MSQARTQFWDMLLPSQTAFRDRFKGSDDTFSETLFRVIVDASGITLPSEEFVLEEVPDLPLEEMGSNPIYLQFLEFIIQISGARRVLEIGAFIGVSTMCLARRLPVDGHVVTIEKFDKFAAIARRNFAANGLADKITLIEADAADATDYLSAEDRFDLIFIDGNKERYLDHFMALEKYLAPGGIMVVDDCFFHGDALNASPSSKKGSGVKTFLTHIADRDDYLRVVLPLANGIMLLTRTESDGAGPATVK